MVDKGDESQLTVSTPIRIEKLVPGGDGLGHLKEGVVFVPLTVPGDLVTLKGVHRRRGVHFAQCDTVIENSPDRREPPCPWFGLCGGCQWMHLEYEAQLRFKEGIFRQALTRIARLENPTPVRIHAAPSQYGYRFRAKIHIRFTKAGFYARSSREVITWDRCMLLPEVMNLAVNGMRAWLEEEPAPRGLESCEIAASPVDGRITAAWYFAKPGSPRDQILSAMDRFSDTMVRGGLELAGQAAFDHKGQISGVGGGALSLEVQGVPMQASPGTFFQINPEVNEILASRVLAHLQSAGASTLLDLYCGNGNFSLPAAAAGVKTTGVESSGKAVSDARSSGGGGSRFIKKDVAQFLSRTDETADAVFVDPPRTGLPAEVAALLGAVRAPTLVYVSCEPPTLARDLARLIGNGYQVTAMEIFDMFPQTSHLESLVVLKG